METANNKGRAQENGELAYKKLTEALVDIKKPDQLASSSAETLLAIRKWRDLINNERRPSTDERPFSLKMTRTVQLIYLV